VSGEAWRVERERLTRDALEFTLAREETPDQLLPDLALLSEKLFRCGKDYRDFGIFDTKR
jgi:hypothetical protein